MTDKRRQRIILSTKKVDGNTHIFTLEEFRNYIKRVEELNLSSRARFHVAPLDSEEELSVRIWAEIPEKAPKVALGKVVRIKKKTNLQIKVQEQLEQRKEDVKNGTAKGYVPPVGGKKRIRRKRKRAGQ